MATFIFPKGFYSPQQIAQTLQSANIDEYEGIFAIRKQDQLSLDVVELEITRQNWGVYLIQEPEGFGYRCNAVTKDVYGISHTKTLISSNTKLALVNEKVNKEGLTVLAEVAQMCHYHGRLGDSMEHIQSAFAKKADQIIEEQLEHFAENGCLNTQVIEQWRMFFAIKINALEKIVQEVTEFQL